MVVGPKDQRFNHDVGALQRIPALPYLCEQRQNVANYRISGDNLFCIFDFHISSYVYCPRDPFGGAAMKLRNYDYYLIILTTLILFAIGAVSLYGIAYYNYLAVDSQWTRPGNTASILMKWIHTFIRSFYCFLFHWDFAFLKGSLNRIS